MNTNNNNNQAVDNNQQVNKEKSSDDVEMTELTQLDKDKAVVQAQMEVCERTREEVRKVIAPAPVDHDASDLWTNAVNPHELTLAQKKEVVDQHDMAMAILKSIKASFLEIHPHEPLFGGVPANASSIRTKEPLPPRMVKELPGFRFKYDPAPIGIKPELIHTDVVSFLTHFERVFSINGKNIEEHYQQPLSWCLSTTLLNHYQSQKAAMEAGKEETWAMAKEWISSFVETPANLIVNVQNLFNIRHRRNESSTAFFSRIREARRLVRADKISFDQLLSMVLICGTPVEWQRTFQKEMQISIKEKRGSEQEVMEMLMKLECDTVPIKRHNEDLVPSPPKKTRVDPDAKPSTTHTKKCTNKWTDPATGQEHTCGQPYYPMHNKVCSVLALKHNLPAATSTNASTVANKSKNQHWNRQKAGSGNNKQARAATKYSTTPAVPHKDTAPGKHGWSEPESRAANKSVASSSYATTVTMAEGSGLCRSKYAPKPNFIQEIGHALTDDNYISADDPIDRIECKVNKTTHKQKHKLTKSSQSNQEIDGEVCVPVLVGTIPVMALVDGGANFSALDRQFCLDNKITVVPYEEPISIGLADSKMQSVLQGRTQELQIHYNYTTYTVTLDVMDLAASKDMSIGTDLMRTLDRGRKPFQGCCRTKR
ncbi:hypothetical protein [Absidia glauca]|uniref:Uncharacterized protein n=1 Tax=Absidia glauca TaxID=4829 RepID=A0A163TJ12_ABSGL|nr:hypothetical protein [Absidia glauca]